MENQKDALNVYPRNCIIHIYNSDANVNESCNGLLEIDDAKEQKTCTMCGKQMDEFDLQEHFGFDYSVGYGSKHDGEILHADLCCNCFDTLLDHMIPLCKTSPIVGDYD